MMLMNVSRLADKTFKREFAVVIGLAWTASFLHTVFFAEVERIAAVSPLIQGTCIGVWAFVAAAAGVHYMRPKPPPEASL
jgi:hypothetical protein